MKKTFLQILSLEAFFNITLYRILCFFKPMVLPLLLAVLPSFFHYGNNSAILLLSSLTRMIIFYGGVGIVLYIIILILNRGHSTQSANATFVFLVFFNIYGMTYDYLLKLDIVQVEHYTLLPFFVLIAVYTSWLITGIKASHSIQFWNNTTIILGGLIIFNAIKIIPSEVKKGEELIANEAILVDANLSADLDYPDIYYIVFDEFSGFEPMRKYWHYEGVDDFAQFLKSKDFFVAEKSHSSTIFTVYELASRLNYKSNYPCCDSYRTYFEAISDSKVVQYLKARGYATVAFEELRSSFPSDVDFQYDYFYESDPNSPPVSATFLDEFGVLVTDETMIRAFSQLYKPYVLDPFLKNHRNMIYFTVDKIAKLDEVQSPKFVYVHLLLPHVPFMFDANGNVIDQQYRNNWNYYLGNYIFTTKIAEKIVNNLMAQADPKRPPIIILQSDHGARNQIIHDNESTLLKNFPEEYKTSILFALYMPGYDISTIPQDVNPINTFPIIFNHLFDANIPLE